MNDLTISLSVKTDSGGYVATVTIIGDEQTFDYEFHGYGQTPSEAQQGALNEMLRFVYDN